jgi:hypothetical protein
MRGLSSAMSAEPIVATIACALAAAIALAWFGRGRRWQPSLSVGGALAAAVLLATAWVPARPFTPELDVATRPIADAEQAPGGYVGSSSCRACHPHEHATWQQSYHRTMTQRTAPHTVLADWDGVVLTAQGRTWKLLRRGDEFWVDLDDPVVPPGGGAGRVQRRVAMSTGSHAMQVYWYESGYERVLGLLPFSWQVDERRWITRLDSFVQPPTDPLQPALGAWNLVCVKCHATHGRPRLDLDTTGLHGAQTLVAEFGIACEACHGPGQAHVAAHRDPAHRYAVRLADGRDPTIVDPADLPPDRATMVCGQCHGQFDYRFDEARMRAWSSNGFAYRPGDDVLAHRRLKFEGEGQFWSDGLIRVAGREYNALAKSQCHERGGMTCTTCHRMHQPAADERAPRAWADDQLAPGDAGTDGSCVKCHADVAARGEQHTHHRAGSAGASCVNCHMPHTTYGLMKAVRTHRIASPSVQSTLATGRPNACNQCHLDRTLRWTAEHLHAWYGTPVPALSADDGAIAAGALWALQGDAAQRALVAWALGWQPAREAGGTDWTVPFLAELLDDPYGVVRIVAERSLRTLPAHAGLRCDPGAPEAVRREHKAAVLAAWRAALPVDAAARPAVLLGARGELAADTFARLLRARDLRVVRLEE